MLGLVAFAPSRAVLLERADADLLLGDAQSPARSPALVRRRRHEDIGLAADRDIDELGARHAPGGQPLEHQPRGADDAREMLLGVEEAVDMPRGFRPVLALAVHERHHEAAARREMAMPVDPLVLRAELHDAAGEPRRLRRRPGGSGFEPVHLVDDESAVPADRPFRTLDDHRHGRPRRRQAESIGRAPSRRGGELSQRLGLPEQCTHQTLAAPCVSACTRRRTRSVMSTCACQPSTRAALLGSPTL